MRYLLLALAVLASLVTACDDQPTATATVPVHVLPTRDLLVIQAGDAPTDLLIDDLTVPDCASVSINLYLGQITPTAMGTAWLRLESDEWESVVPVSAIVASGYWARFDDQQIGEWLASGGRALRVSLANALPGQMVTITTDTFPEVGQQWKRPHVEVVTKAEGD